MLLLSGILLKKGVHFKLGGQIKTSQKLCLPFELELDTGKVEKKKQPKQSPFNSENGLIRATASKCPFLFEKTNCF